MFMAFAIGEIGTPGASSTDNMFGVKIRQISKFIHFREPELSSFYNTPIKIIFRTDVSGNSKQYGHDKISTNVPAAI